MDNSTFMQKLAINFANSWKMFSAWGIGVFTVIMAWFTNLPATATGCTPPGGACMTQTSVLSHLGLSASAISVILGLIVYYLRIHPQSNISTVVAEQKSMSAPLPATPPIITPITPTPTPVDVDVSSPAPTATGETKT